MEKSFLYRAFLLLILFGILYLCFMIFRPVLSEIIVAGVLATTLYPVYSKLTAFLGGRRKTAALLLTIAAALVIIIPLANLIVYAAGKLIDAYGELSQFINQGNFDTLVNNRYVARFVSPDSTFRSYLLDGLQLLNGWIIAVATSLIKGATNFVFSMLLIILTMFFFLIDGEAMLNRLMRWTPLPNRYDARIFKKFKDVSLITVGLTFIIGIAQGLLGALAFFVVGLPPFLGGVLILIFSLVPYVGSALIWFPAAIYLLFTGQIWQGIFLLIWGFSVISVIDNVIRAYLIKGKSQVHPIFIIFSIIGGVTVFGYWGVIFGPLIISVAVTILHIYELEYESILEK